MKVVLWIIGLFTLAPAVCYVLSAIIAKRYYTLKTPFLTKILASWRRVRAAISRSLKTCRSAKNCRTKRTKA